MKDKKFKDSFWQAELPQMEIQPEEEGIKGPIKSPFLNFKQKIGSKESVICLFWDPSKGGPPLRPPLKTGKKVLVAFMASLLGGPLGAVEEKEAEKYNFLPLSLVDQSITSFIEPKPIPPSSLSFNEILLDSRLTNPLSQDMDLPPEIWVEIFSSLPTTALKQLSSVSFQTKELVCVAMKHKTVTLRSPPLFQGVWDEGLTFKNPFFTCASFVKLPTEDPYFTQIIKAVGKFPRLKALEFNASTNQIIKKELRDEDLKLLKECTQLTSLNLQGCEQITNKGLKSLKGLNRLSSLNLWGCKEITDEGLGDLLKELPHLTSLDLGYCSQLTSEVLKSLAHLKHLTSLSLWGCYGITGKELKLLKKLNHLSILSLGRCGITDKGLKSLAPLTHLTSLNLGGCEQITDEGLKSLKGLTGLTSLNLWTCSHITNKILKSLTSFTYLTSLDLSWCKEITDEGLLELLKELTNLTFLDLSITKVSQGGVERLRKELPACQILL
jgi:hypothetical protein